MSKRITPIQMDKQRHLKSGTNNMIFLEKELGRPLDKMGESFSYEDMRTVFYCFLKWEDETLTYEKMGDLIDDYVDEHGLESLSEKMAEAMSKIGGGGAVPSG